MIQQSREPESGPNLSLVGEHAGGHIILCGLDGLGLRTLEELCRLGEDVVVVAKSPSETFVQKARELGASFVMGNHWEEPVLRKAGVTTARAIILTDKDDVSNLHAGLVAQDLHPGIPIIIHMFNTDLGQQVKALYENCEVLSSSEIAAPAFIAAALHHDWEQRIDVAGHSLVVRTGKAAARVWGKNRGAVTMGSDTRILLPLACIKGDGTATLFPDAVRKASAQPPIGTVCEDVVFLVDEGPVAAPQPSVAAVKRRRRDPQFLLNTMKRLFFTADWRLRWLSGMLLILTVISAILFSLFQDLTLLDALYFTISTITTTGFGDISLIDAHPALKVYGTFLMVMGAAALAIFYALITDVLVGARLAQMVGPDMSRIREHVIVCGLGTIGYLVVERLFRLGVPVVGVEVDPNGRFLPLLRRMGVPLLVADARLPETLQSLGVGRARCLVAAIDGDIANLQTALTARSLNPQLRTVLRLFDPDLSARMERTFEIQISRSPAALAAPAMIAAAVGGHVLAPVQVADQVVFIAETVIDPGSQADGNSVEALEASAEDEEGGPECRVLLLIDDGTYHWQPDGKMRMRAGQHLVLAVSQYGLAHVLALTSPGPPGHWPVASAKQ